MEEKSYLDWEYITDAMVMSDEWDNWRYNLESELDMMCDKKIFKECQDENFGQTYLNHAAETIRKGESMDKSNLSLIWELRETIKDQAAWMVFMKTLRLVTITNRSGIFPRLAQAEAEKKDYSRIKRETKKRIIRAAISNIFKKHPTMPKTFGVVWDKFDVVNKNEIFQCPKDEIHWAGKVIGELKKGDYRVKIGKGKKGKEAIIITKDNEWFGEYAQRSLQPFINELK
jgi:hypothetical protein